MKETRALRETSRSELVETHNIALALGRMGTGYYDDPWKRALYHALSMSGVQRSTLEKVRQALELP